MLAADPACTQVAVGDVDGDGLPDLVTLSVEVVKAKKGGSASYVGTLDVQVGNRDGSFGQINPVRHTGRVLPGNPTGIAVGDLDGDGRADVAIGCAATDAAGLPTVALELLLNDGKGGFGEGGPETRRTWVIPHVLETSGAIAVGDVNGDGAADVVVGGAVASGVGVAAGMMPGGGIVSAAFVRPNSDGTVTQPTFKSFVIPHVLEKAGVKAEFNEVTGLAAGYFQKGDKPTQQQFAAWDDSTASAVVLDIDGAGEVALAAYTQDVIRPREAGSGLATGRRMAGAGDVDGDGLDDFVALADGKDGLAVSVGRNQSADGRGLRFAWTVTPAPEPSGLKVKEKGNRTKSSNNLRTLLADFDPKAPGVDVVVLDPVGADSADVYVIGVVADPASHALKVIGPKKTGHVSLLR